MTTLRLLADDLTGALDAVSPFCQADMPIPVIVQQQGIVDRSGSWGVNSQTRDGSREEAILAVRRFASSIEEKGISFKKIDSMLRGHSAVEIAAFYELGRFPTIIVAPSFPRQGRITVQGRQLYRAESSDEWRSTDPQLDNELKSLGVEVKRVAAQGRLGGEGVFLCDASTEDDLRHIARSGTKKPQPILWCGSAGLAAALSEAKQAQPEPRSGSTLLFLASSHEATQRQVSHMKAINSDRVFIVEGHEEPGTRGVIDVVAANLSRNDWALIHMRVTARQSRNEIAARIDQVISLLKAKVVPKRLICGGGDTLWQICMALGSYELVVRGEIAPGIPVSDFADGAWTGTQVISKSGGFGGSHLLADLLHRRT